MAEIDIAFGGVRVNASTDRQTLGVLVIADAIKPLPEEIAPGPELNAAICAVLRRCAASIEAGRIVYLRPPAAPDRDAALLALREALDADTGRP